MGVAEPAGPPDSPYVGLRPFERDERHLFFGRDRDATILCDKILGARLTLFYAQSGLGKSSLLRTLVVPQLEAEHCRVVYHDAWTGDRPADALNAALARAGGVGAAAESLLQAARAAVRASDRTVVLILDQFEEFLIAHAQRLDPLREELGALVRARDVDVHVVLSLREELLAALDPFRHAVVDLYQSTHRLEPLATDAVRDAIARPAQLAGGAVAGDLVEILIRDLRAESDAGAAADAPAAEAVDLPMLQLVCRELWTSAGTPGARPELTEALYRATGGARAVLDRYVLGIMPRAWGDRLVVARLMRMLAPPSGFKASYSLEDLAAGTGVARVQVETAIDRLGRARLVRAREVGHGRRYELQHDAFIRILAPWRDDVLRRAGVRRRLWQAAAAVGAVAVLGAAGAALLEWRDRAELDRNTIGAFAELRREVARGEAGRADVTFKSATNYLLWQRSEPARFERLRSLLRENVDLLPANYGLDESAQGVIAPEPDDWPAVVDYAPGRDLDAAQFRTRWHNQATAMALRWGVPVPLRIRLRVDEALPQKKLRLSLEGSQPLDADGVPDHEALFVVSPPGLSATVQGFVNSFAADWREIPQLRDRRPSYAVPLWSLPVWRSAGATVQGGSVLPATMIFQEIGRRPEFVVTPEAVEVLLSRVAARYPRAVDEVRAARGPALNRDLAELVRREIPLTALPVILDDLAGHSGVPPTHAAAAVAASIHQAEPDAGGALGGPWSSGPDPQAMRLNARLVAASREAEPWLPRVEPPLRVDIGAGLDARWLRAGGLRDDLIDALETVRERLFDRFGIILPGVTFRFATDIPANSFRIAVLAQTPDAEDAQPIRTTLDESVLELADAVARRGEAQRKRWITADTVATDLDGLGPRTHEWVSARYSLTDLKQLLRGAAKEDAGLAAAPSLPAEALLTTLPFWDSMHGRRDAAILAEAMATVRLPATPAVPGSVQRDLVRGLDALFDDDPEGATTAFAAARGASRATDLSASFVAEFRERWLDAVEKNLGAKCQPPFDARPSLPERLWLLRVVDGREGSPSEASKRVASLCLLGEYGVQKRRVRELELLAGIATRSGPLEAWPPGEADWLAKRMLERFDVAAEGPNQLAFVAQLLRSAIDSGDPMRHGGLVRAWILVCQKPGPMNWCWTVADEFADRDGISPHATLELALALSPSERRRDLLRAVALAERAERQIARDSATWLSDGEAKRLAPFAIEARARALAGLAMYHGDGEADLAAQDALRRLEALPEYAETAATILVALHRARGRGRDAAQRIDAVLVAQPTNAALIEQRLWLAIESGDRATTLAALDALEQADESSHHRFSIALGRMMTRSGEWEERTRTVIKQGVYFADYARMILSALKAGDAPEESDELVERRAQEMRRDSWPARLRGGDATAWREMLLAFVAGDVPRDAVFAPLADDSLFVASDLAALAMPRRALLCEAHFYDAMRARKEGDSATMIAALRAAVAADYPTYYEHAMARYLLAEMVGR